MAGKRLRPSWHEVVRANHRRTTGYIVAQSGDCLEYQAAETPPPQGRVPGRDFQPLPLETLYDFRPPASWLLAILICPRDDVDAIVDASAQLPADTIDRVILFIHPDCNRDEIQTRYDERGIGLPKEIALPKSWRRFHQIYGRLHGDRVYADHPTFR